MSIATRVSARHQLGVLFIFAVALVGGLLATPITRAMVSALPFARLRDRTYVIVTPLVLVLLLMSLLTG